METSSLSTVTRRKFSCHGHAITTAGLSLGLGELLLPHQGSCLDSS